MTDATGVTDTAGVTDDDAAAAISKEEGNDADTEDSGDEQDPITRHEGNENQPILTKSDADTSVNGPGPCEATVEEHVKDVTSTDLDPSKEPVISDETSLPKTGSPEQAEMIDKLSSPVNVRNPSIDLSNKVDVTLSAPLPVNMPVVPASADDRPSVPTQNSHERTTSTSETAESSLSNLSTNAEDLHIKQSSLPEKPMEATSSGSFSEMKPSNVESVSLNAALSSEIQPALNGQLIDKNADKVSTISNQLRNSIERLKQVEERSQTKPENEHLHDEAAEEHETDAMQTEQEVTSNAVNSTEDSFSVKQGESTSVERVEDAGATNTDKAQQVEIAIEEAPRTSILSSQLKVHNEKDNMWAEIKSPGEAPHEPGKIVDEIAVSKATSSVLTTPPVKEHSTDLASEEETPEGDKQILPEKMSPIQNKKESDKIDVEIQRTGDSDHSKQSCPNLSLTKPKAEGNEASNDGSDSSSDEESSDEELMRKKRQLMMSSPPRSPSPIRSPEPETSVPPIRSPVPETLVSPIRSPEPETSVPPIRSPKPETLVPPIRSPEPEISAPPVRSPELETSASPIRSPKSLTSAAPIRSSEPVTSLSQKEDYGIKTKSLDGKCETDESSSDEDSEDEGPRKITMASPPRSPSPPTMLSPPCAPSPCKDLTSNGHTPVTSSESRQGNLDGCGTETEIGKPVSSSLRAESPVKITNTSEDVSQSKITRVRATDSVSEGSNIEDDKAIVSQVTEIPKSPEEDKASVEGKKDINQIAERRSPSPNLDTETKKQKCETDAKDIAEKDIVGATCDSGEQPKSGKSEDKTGDDSSSSDESDSGDDDDDDVVRVTVMSPPRSPSPIRYTAN